MNTDFRHWSKTLEPVIAMNNTMMQCAQEIARCNLNLTAECISMGLKQCQSPLTQKKPEEWVQMQVNMTCEAVEKAVKALQKSSETMMEAMTECRSKCEDMVSNQCHSCGSTQSSASTDRPHHRKS
ncbi:MAG: hypothetical protein RLZ35_871 [Pseudomonadota bacterium]|jgi:hypothetical protein